MTLFLLENEIVTSSTETRHTSIFERMLAQYTTQYAQSYFSLAIYFFLAFALCGLLAGLAYLLSLSTAQETEKRSEYECGFAPFDSATRLPFDVHFYLVGILFLIFDVEVALLFPWVLSLRTVGWFGFYLMFAFLLILSIGFLYEWKRGALLWPSRRDSVVIRKRNTTTQASFFPPCDKIIAHVKLFRSEYISAVCAIGILLSLLRLCTLSTEELVEASLVYLLSGPDIFMCFHVLYMLYVWFREVFLAGATNPDPTKEEIASTLNPTNEEIDPALLEKLIRAAIEQRRLDADTKIAEQASQDNPPAPSTLKRFLDALERFLDADCPMLLEGLLFALICFVITVLSLSLDEEGNDGALSYLSWQAFRTGLVLLSCLAFLDLITPTVGDSVLEGFFEVGTLSCLLKVIALFSALFVLDYSAMYLREHSRSLLEYAAIVAFTTFFMLLLVSAAHVMSLFLSLVGFSLGLYVLIMYDASLAPSREAGLKYYYLSALSSGLILYGLILIYITGSNGSFRELFVLFSTNLAPNSLLLACTAVLIALIGFFFKLSSVPGHLWAPDVYEGSPAPVTAFFMLPVKVVVLAAFIQLFALTLVPLSAFWLPTLSVAVAISILWGAFAAVQEKKIRRFFAYASINQMGFLLMGLTTDSDAGFSAAALYILVYAVMTGAFLLIYLTTRLADGRQLLYVSDFRALGATNWPVAFALATILFSMAGIPPLAGFFVKYFVLLEAFLAGQLLLVIIGLALSLVAAYYYLRFIKTSLFESTAGAARIVLHLTWGNLLLLIVLDAFLWGFMLYASELTEFTSIDLLELHPDFLEEEDLILGDEDDFLEGEYDLVDEGSTQTPAPNEWQTCVCFRPPNTLF